MDLILAIAALCQMTPGSSAIGLSEQKACQAYFAKCIQEEGKVNDAPERKLLACIEKRK